MTLTIKMSVINNLRPPKDIRLEMAERFKRVRLDRNLTQEQLSERSGVSLGSLRRFEAEGEISLKNLVNLSIALNCAQDFDELFQLEEKLDLFKPKPKRRQRATGKRRLSKVENLFK